MRVWYVKPKPEPKPNRKKESKTKQKTGLKWYRISILAFWNVYTCISLRSCQWPGCFNRLCRNACALAYISPLRSFHSIPFKSIECNKSLSHMWLVRNIQQFNFDWIARKKDLSMWEDQIFGFGFIVLYQKITANKIWNNFQNIIVWNEQTKLQTLWPLRIDYYSGTCVPQIPYRKDSCFDDFKMKWKKNEKK